jgi:hypothetical protein
MVLVGWTSGSLQARRVWRTRSSLARVREVRTRRRCGPGRHPTWAGQPEAPALTARDRERSAVRLQQLLRLESPMDQPHLSSRATRVEAATTPRCTRTQSFHSSPITVRIVTRTAHTRRQPESGVRPDSGTHPNADLHPHQDGGPHQRPPDPRCRLWANRRVRSRPAQSVKDQVNPDSWTGSRLRTYVWGMPSTAPPTRCGGGR